MPTEPSATRTASAGPVVICCASADEPAIAPVLEGLAAEGHSVELLPGVETDAAALEPTIERFRGEGLYVLCRSRALGRDAVDALRDVLLANHVPFGRTLTVASTRPRELRERITASLRRMAAGRARRMSQVPPEGKPPRSTRLGIPTATESTPRPPSTPEPRPKRVKTARPARATRMGIVPPSVRPHPTPVPKSDPPPSSKPSADVVATAAALDDVVRARGTVGPDDAPTRREIQALAAPEADEVESPQGPFDDEVKTGVRMAGSGAPPADSAPDSAPIDLEDDESPTAPAPLPGASEPTEDSIVRAAVITPDELADLDVELDSDALELSASDLEVAEVVDAAPPGPPVRSGSTDIARALTRAEVAGVRTGNTQVTAAVPTVSADMEPAAPPSPISADLEAAIRTGDTALVRRSDLLATGLTDAPSSPPPAAAATPSPAASSPASDDAKPFPWLWVGAGAAAVLVVGVAIAVVSGDDDGTEADEAPLLTREDASLAEDPKENPPADADVRDEPAEPAEPATGDRAPSEGRTRIGHALRSRKVQALDVLLVSNTEGPFDFSAAQAHCSGLDIEGLADWRVPEVGELMSLTSARMTGRGYYWSATPADTFGDTPLVWYARRSRVVTRAQDNYVVCVRGGSSAG